MKELTVPDRVYLTAGKQVIQVICAWELVALHSRLPTLTQVVHLNRHRWLCRSLAVSALVWVSYHLLLEESEWTRGVARS